MSVHYSGLPQALCQSLPTALAAQPVEPDISTQSLLSLSAAVSTLLWHSHKRSDVHMHQYWCNALSSIGSLVTGNKLEMILCKVAWGLTIVSTEIWWGSWDQVSNQHLAGQPESWAHKPVPLDVCKQAASGIEKNSSPILHALGGIISNNLCSCTRKALATGAPAPVNLKTWLSDDVSFRNKMWSSIL